MPFTIRRNIIVPALLAMGIVSASLAQAQDRQEEAHDAAAPDNAGRQLFTDWSCGTCHRLNDADGSGNVGPALDGNAALTPDHIAAAISEGQGAMPGFGDQMTDRQIASLAAYIMAAKE